VLLISQTNETDGSQSTNDESGCVLLDEFHCDLSEVHCDKEKRSEKNNEEREQQGRRNMDKESRVTEYTTG
jgi:hypothetical protein